MGGCSLADTSTLADQTTGDIDNAQDHEEASDYAWSVSDERTITLSGSSISSGASGVNISGTTATIVAGGTYRIGGSLSDGQIIVNAPDSGVVRLILDGASITRSGPAPLYVEAADKVVLVLADGTANILKDGSYTSEDDPDAALFSTADLSLHGSGTLTVTGNSYDAIACKDGLVINGPILNITAADDGIRGKDYVVIRSGTLTVTAGGDGITSNRDDTSTGYGYVTVEGGTVVVNSGGDALSAEGNQTITGGTLSLTAGGGAATALGSISAKGIKAGRAVIASGGDSTVSSADDALHAEGNVYISGGSFVLSANSSSGQGIKFGAAMAGSISGDTTDINIKSSFEGIAGYSLSISGGTIRLVSSDDGISCSAGTGSTESDGASFAMTGGYLYMNASGDGADSNGDMNISGGVIIIDGPKSGQANAAIDYNGSFAMTGGFLLAIGSSSMIEFPSTLGQNTIKVALSGTSSAGMGGSSSSGLSAGTLVHVQDASGTDVLTFAPAKSFQHMIFSSPDLKASTSYSVYTGGSVSGGSKNDGLYGSVSASDWTFAGSSTYAAGTLKETVTFGSSSGIK